MTKHRLKAMSLTPPPGIDLLADKGPRVTSSGIALIILPTLFVIVRFVSRAIARAGFWWGTRTSELLCPILCQFLSTQDIFGEQNPAPTLVICLIDPGHLLWISNADSKTCVDDLLVVVSLLLSYGPNTAMMICMCSLSLAREI